MNVPQAIGARLLPAVLRAGFREVPSSDKWPNIATQDGIWSFSNGKVRLDVFYASQTGELSLGLEHSEGPAVPFALLLERQRDPDAEWAGHGLMLYELGRAEAALARLAGAFDRNAAALADLTLREVADLYEAWLEESRIATERMDVERGVAKAEEQWRLGNYSGCAAILSGIEGDLTPAQRKRLAMARQKAQVA